MLCTVTNTSGAVIAAQGKTLEPGSSSVLNLTDRLWSMYLSGKVDITAAPKTDDELAQEKMLEAKPTARPSSLASSAPATTPVFTGAQAGLVPSAATNGTARVRFLREDGQWMLPDVASEDLEYDPVLTYMLSRG